MKKKEKESSLGVEIRNLIKEMVKEDENLYTVGLENMIAEYMVDCLRNLIRYLKYYQHIRYGEEKTLNTIVKKGKK